MNIEVKPTPAAASMLGEAPMIARVGVVGAGQMLDGTRNSDSNVKLRGDDFSGLADLVVVRHESGIHRGTGSPDRSTKLISNRFQKLKVLAGLHAAAAGNHHAGGGQFGAFAL